jgi:transposase InsO family protein
MAKAHILMRCADGAEGASFDGPHQGGRGADHRLPQTHPVAAGRLSLCLAGDSPAPDAVVSASLLSAPWHQPAAGDGGRQAQQEDVQSLPHRLLPHIDIAEVRTEEGKLYLFVAIDRTSKFAYAELHAKAKRQTASDFLKALIKAVPYKIHTVLTDNGIQFADLPKNRMGPTALWRGHIFDRVCDENGIEHRLTKPNHPWTNGQVERMNRTLKEATVKRYHYGTHAQLKGHIHAFLMAYNFAKRLKSLRGLTAYEYICKIWTKQPKRFRLNPMHHTLGLNT